MNIVAFSLTSTKRRAFYDLNFTSVVCCENKDVMFLFLLHFLYEPPHDETNKCPVRPAKTQIRPV